jgi:hypothetical protein
LLGKYAVELGIDAMGLDIRGDELAHRLLQRE